MPHRRDRVEQPAGEFSFPVGKPQPRGGLPQQRPARPLEERRQRRREIGLVEGIDDPGRLLPLLARRRVPGSGGHFPEHLPGEPGFVEQFEGPAPPRPRHHRPQFRRNPFRAHGRHEMGHLLDRRPRLTVERECKTGGEPHGPQHSQVVFAKPHRGHADGPHDARLEILPTAHVVVHLARDGIEKEPVNREIPSLGVFFRAGKRHAGRVPAVGVGGISAEGCHFDLACLAKPAVRVLTRPQHGDHTKRRPDGEGPAAAKHSPHLVRLGRRGHVVIDWNPTQKFVPHASPGPKSLIPRRPQPANDFEGKLPCLLWVGHFRLHEIVS